MEATAELIVTGTAPVKDAEYWVSWHLENWARWVRAPDLPETYPVHSCGGVFENYKSYDPDSKDARASHDQAMAETVDWAIQDLPPAERITVHLHYGVTKKRDVEEWPLVYRFPRGNEHQLMRSARQRIRRALAMRGVWLGG